MGSEECGEEVSHKPFGLLVFLNRPMCWKHGHEFPPIWGVHDCRRCGKNNFDHAFSTMVLVIILALLVAIKKELVQWYKRLRDVQ